MRIVRLLLCLALPLGTTAFAKPKAPAGTAAATAQAADACAHRGFERTSFTICTFDAAHDELRLAVIGADGTPLQSFARLRQSLGADAGRVRFAMNAGMFGEDGLPIGLYVERAKERHALNLASGGGNFHMTPNGVFAADMAGHVSVTPTMQFRQRIQHPYWATQSGPMLVVDGLINGHFSPNGPSRLIRNGVCAPRGDRAVFAISNEPVSFGRFARLFRDGLGCRNALYLDGNVSSLWDPGASRQDVASSLGPMVVVLKAAPQAANEGR